MRPILLAIATLTGCRAVLGIEEGVPADAAACVGCDAPCVETPRWTAVAPMKHARARHTATLLRDGRVLVTGGFDGAEALSSAEVYDPATNSWTEEPPMAIRRSHHLAFLLPSGKVLVTSGWNFVSATVWESHSSSEIYDPSAHAWAPAAPLSVERAQAVGLSLSDGRALVSGGAKWGAGFWLTAEVFDERTGIWTPTKGDAAPLGASVTMLGDGRIVAAGGFLNSKYEAASRTFNTPTNSWSAVASLSAARAHHAAALTADGRVIVFGGETPVRTIEAFDPKLAGWSEIANLGESAEHNGLSATPLANGKILVVGATTSRLFDPAAASFSAFGAPPSPHGEHATAALDRGPVKRVMVSGGRASATGQIVDAKFRAVAGVDLLTLSCP